MAAPMRMGLVISKLFPSGGLQRDCIAVANLLLRRGHDVTVLTSAREGKVSIEAPVEVFPQFGLNNSARGRGLMRSVEARCGSFDRVIGFNKLPGLDVYYCADPPYADIPRG